VTRDFKPGEKYDALIAETIEVPKSHVFFAGLVPNATNRQRFKDVTDLNRDIAVQIGRVGKIRV